MLKFDKLRGPKNKSIRFEFVTDNLLYQCITSKFIPNNKTMI